MDRDIAVVVPLAVPAGAVEEIISSTAACTCAACGSSTCTVVLPLGGDERSLAYRLRFEAVDGTLPDSAVEAAVERVVAVLSARLGARLRA